MSTQKLMIIVLVVLVVIFVMMLGTMQSLTGGRFVLGLGRGVTLAQDAYGIPLPKIVFKIGDNERRMIEEMYDTCETILHEAKAGIGHHKVGLLVFADQLRPQGAERGRFIEHRPGGGTRAPQSQCHTGPGKCKHGSDQPRQG